MFPNLRPNQIAPWILAVYTGVCAIVLAVSLFSDVPLDIEGGPLSFLDAFLVFILAGLLLVLGTYGEWRMPLRSGYLLGTVLAFGVGIIQLVGLLDGETPIVEELDTGDTICWLIAGGFLAWMLRAARKLYAAERFLILGFVLQSFSLVADVTDGMFVELPDLFDWIFGPGEEISEVLFLATYCCGCGLLVSRSTAEALRWRQEGVRAHDMLEPAMVIKRAHFALRWRQRRGLSRCLTVFQLLTLPIRFCGELAWHLAQNGSRVRQNSGKGFARQLVEAIYLGATAGVPAASYYKFDLFFACNRKLARHFVHRQEFKGAWGINRLFRRLPGARSPLGDRMEFASHCAKSELATTPVLAHGSGGKVLVLTENGSLPQSDLVARANKASAGIAAQRWHWTGELYTDGNQTCLSAAQLLESIARSSVEAGIILQPLRRNHRLLNDLAHKALTTVRVLTCLDESGQPEITHAMLRMPHDEDIVVTGTSPNPLYASVDLAQGRLGWATDRGLGDSVGWIGIHPDSGAIVTGRVLPLWRETRALAVRAHRACLDRTVVAWDVVIGDNGVELMGADPEPDLEMIQRIHSRPLGLDRLGRLIAFHVRDTLR